MLRAKTYFLQFTGEVLHLGFRLIRFGELAFGLRALELVKSLSLDCFALACILVLHKLLLFLRMVALDSL